MSTVRIEGDIPFVGDRALPWAAKIEVADSGPRDWRSRHFWLEFENGWTLSVTFGSGTYSSNHNYGFGSNEWHEAATMVEVAAWPFGGELVTWDDGDTVKGYVGVDDLSRLIDVMMEWPSVPPDGFVASCDGPSQAPRTSIVSDTQPKENNE